MSTQKDTKKIYTKPTINKIGKISNLTLGMIGVICDGNNATTGGGNNCPS